MSLVLQCFSCSRCCYCCCYCNAVQVAVFNFRRFCCKCCCYCNASNVVDAVIVVGIEMQPRLLFLISEDFFLNVVVLKCFLCCFLCCCCNTAQVVVFYLEDFVLNVVGIEMFPMLLLLLQCRPGCCC